MSSSTVPDVRTSPNDQLRITATPTNAISGSIHTQPKASPHDRATIASTEVIASASTCT